MSWQLSAFADEASELLDEQITALQRAGLSMVDLRNLDGCNISELPLDHAERVKAKLDDAGIAVGMFGSPIGKIDLDDDPQTDRDKLTHLSLLADIFDTRDVRIFSYFNKAEAPMDAWQAGSLERLSVLRDMAAKMDLVLYHENERFIFGDRLAQVQVLADELRGEHFKLIFDFDNYNQSGDDVPANWQALKDVTDALHLKDSTKEGVHVPIGEGATSARQLLAEALDAGFDGPISLEPHLQHSAGVAATGPHGEANQAYADMSPADAFHIAAEKAKALFAEIGA